MGGRGRGLGRVFRGRGWGEKVVGFGKGERCEEGGIE